MPKLRSQGGNQSIVKNSFRKAPKGKFRVIGADTSDGIGWTEDDFPSFAQAKRVCDEKTRGKEMLKMHIYDDTGTHRYETGGF